jgi:hypothetical protein
MRIAILGWSSLLWDHRPDFDRWHARWHNDGPALKLEFSRVSNSRGGALTLVIDPVCGVFNTVVYTLSRRTEIDDGVADLQQREGTTLSHIGYISLAANRERSRDLESGRAIYDWATRKRLDAVVWTDLPSNFADKTGRPFSVLSALEYLGQLDSEVRAKAADYIHRPPTFIRTPLRSALTGEPWFVAEAMAAQQRVR